MANELWNNCDDIGDFINTFESDFDKVPPYNPDGGYDPNPSWDHDPTETRLDNNFDDGPEL